MANRLLWLDAIRALAAQLIVFHHFSIYGPVPKVLSQAWPEPIGWLDSYGAVAVQVFLVLSGLLTARSIAASPVPTVGSTMRALGWRYLRLFAPFYVALALVLIAAIPGRGWLNADFLPRPLDLFTLVVHGVGLYDYLGIEALTAGAWYVTMDWQLHALTAVIALGAAQARPTWRRLAFAVMVLALATASLFWINRRPAWDIQPFYFFGSFALGMAAFWLAKPQHPAERTIAILICAIAALSLVVDWRLRIAVALGVALICATALLGLGHRFDEKLRGASAGFAAAGRRMIEYFGDHAYCLFLVHFPAWVLANALFVRFTDGSQAMAALTWGAAWALSLALAFALHRLVEQPLARRRSSHAHE